MLATAYGWSEFEILGLSRARRDAYLAIVGARSAGVNGESPEVACNADAGHNSGDRAAACAVRQRISDRPGIATRRGPSRAGFGVTRAGIAAPWSDGTRSATVHRCGTAGTAGAAQISTAPSSVFPSVAPTQRSHDALTDVIGPAPASAEQVSGQHAETTARAIPPIETPRQRPENAARSGLLEPAMTRELHTMHHYHWLERGTKSIVHEVEPAPALPPAPRTFETRLVERATQPTPLSRPAAAAGPPAARPLCPPPWKRRRRPPPCRTSRSGASSCASNSRRRAHPARPRDHPRPVSALRPTWRRSGADPNEQLTCDRHCHRCARDPRAGTPLMRRD